MNSDEDNVDLFAGPGGWSEGLRALGKSETGLEWDKSAIETARAAGHKRINADISITDPKDYSAKGLIASPPCQAYSPAGKGAGRKNLDVITHSLQKVHKGASIELIEELGERCQDIRAGLVISPLIWAKQLNPEWIALEQVASVLPVWNEMAVYLEMYGYNVATSVLSAADYGVAQSRRRAILVASKKDVQLLPSVTHTKDQHLSVHDVLESSKSFTHLKHNSGHRHRPRVNGKQIVNDPNGGDYYQRFALDKPSPTLTTQLSAWKFDNPTYVDGMLWETGDSRQIRNDEFSVIQSFRADYPWQGTKSDVHRQIGDTIPPLLAQKILQNIA